MTNHKENLEDCVENISSEFSIQHDPDILFMTDDELVDYITTLIYDAAHDYSSQEVAFVPKTDISTKEAN